MKKSTIMKTKTLQISKNEKKKINNFVRLVRIYLCPKTKNNKTNVTKANLANVTGKHFFTNVAKDFQINLNFVKDNDYKVALFMKDNQINININNYDSKNNQKFYLAHALGHLFLNWMYYPTDDGEFLIPKPNLKAVRANNNLMNLCGSLSSYNTPKSELEANYFAEKLMGYDLLEKQA